PPSSAHGSQFAHAAGAFRLRSCDIPPTHHTSPVGPTANRPSREATPTCRARETGAMHDTSAARPANRLSGETSPYLLQHAHNPVDWYPWGPEALERARKEELPILLSVGYAACHWCHVMERESFEDPDTAAFMNEHFVCIKVDREERPDLDAIYMDAVQAMTGSGGWPMTVFLTPDQEPFFGGTYFPDRDRHGMPAFRRVLEAVAEAWRDRRGDAVEQMLYDNAQLALLYLHGWQVLGVPRYRDVAAATLDYLLREMRHPDGGLYSSQDADSEGVEGKFFVWSHEELAALAGPEVAAY